MKVSASVLLALVPFFVGEAAAQASGKTTRYWDCCKGSCAWAGKTSLSTGPLRTCGKDDKPLNDGGSTKSACDNGGSAYMCSDQSPWAVNETVAYGWAAAKLAGKTERDWCCACYELTFTSGAVSGKKFIVQATNTGGDLGQNHFDLAIPGGGVGIFNACSNQFGAPSNGWGDRYGGIHSRSDCNGFPDHLKAGCNWRFDWFKGADNPDVTFKQVTCPKAITQKSGCVRSGETPTGPDTVPTWTAS